MPTFHAVLRHLRTNAALGPAELSDGQLLELFLAHRDEAAFEVLVRRHGPMVLGVCQRVLRNVHDVDDAFQATFLVLVRKAHSIVPRENVANWLFGVAYRTAVKARMLMGIRADRQRQLQAAPPPGPEEKVWLDLLPLLDQELAGLPERYRAPIVLCDLEGKTRKEAARQLGWPEGTVAGRLARGRALLARRLQRRAVAVSGGSLAVFLAQQAAAGAVQSPLVTATVRAALAITGSAVGQISANVAALTQGVLQTMLISKLKLALAVVVAAGLLMLGAALLAYHAPAGARATPDRPPPSKAQTPDQPGPGGAALPDGAVARLGSPKLRHGDTIFFLAYVADGKQLVTAGRDQTVRLWDVKTGSEVHRFEWPAPPKDKAPKEKLPAKGVGGLMPLPDEDPCDLDFIVGVAANDKHVAAQKGDAVLLWETGTGKRLHTIKLASGEGKPGGLEGGDGGFLEFDVLAGSGLLFSGDGKRLIVPVGDQVRVYDVATGKDVGPLSAKIKGLQLAYHSALSPDAKYLARLDLDPQKEAAFVKVLDLTTGNVVAEVKGEVVGVGDLRFAPDSRTLAWTGADGGLQVFEIGKDKEPRPLGKARQDFAGPVTLCFAADSKTVAVLLPDRTIEVCDVTTGKAVKTIGGAGRHLGGPMLALELAVLGQAELALTPDGKTLAASFGGPCVRQFDVTTGKEIVLPDAGHVQPVRAVQVSADGKTLTTAAPDDGVCLWDLTTGKQLRHVAIPAGHVFALSADGKRAAAALGNAVEIWDVAAGKRLKEFTIGEFPALALALSPDGKTVAVRDLENLRIRLFDHAGRELDVLPLREDGNNRREGDGEIDVDLGGFSPELTFSPDGQFLAVTDAGLRLIVWDVGARRKLYAVELTEGSQVEHITFAPSGRVLALQVSDGTTALYEAATGGLRGRLGKPAVKDADGVPLVGPLGGFRGAQAAAPAFSPSGRHLAVSHGLSEIALWDVIAGKEIARFGTQQGGINCLAFNPDGRRLISGGADTTALVWDVSAKVKPAAPAADKLDTTVLEHLWGHLGSKDAGEAFDALCKLIPHSEQTVALARKHLKPTPPLDGKLVARLIADLDSAKFDVRQKATVELEKLGELVLPDLERVLENQPTLEMRQRVEAIRQRIKRPATSSLTVRDLRVVELLELQDTAAAREFLQVLAGWAPGARITAEARAALGRMTR
jgi:RNA polymerase sigma factor (sigma-70 family)